MKRIAFVAAVGLTAMIGFTVPAWAEVETTDVPLKAVHQNSLAEDFAIECEDELLEGQVLWHFVVPSFPGSPNGGGGDLIEVETVFDAGSRLNGEQVQNGKGFNVLTQDATTLVSATGKAVDVQEGQDLIMNLSHTCLGPVPDPDPSPSPTPTPTPTVTPTPTPVPTPTTAPSGEVIATDIATEELAATGAEDAWIPLVAGLLLLLTGAGAVLYTHKG